MVAKEINVSFKPKNINGTKNSSKWFPLLAMCTKRYTNICIYLTVIHEKIYNIHKILSVNGKYSFVL